jgi:hypothetical protein
MSGRTQDLLLTHLRSSPLRDDALLLEALRLRGFLAHRAEGSVWLGPGSHRADLRVLRLIPMLEVVPTERADLGAAALRLAATARPPEVAEAILALPEHHMGQRLGKFTTTGPSRYLKRTWLEYRTMRWGAKLPVCTAAALDQDVASGSLDVGVARLVKTLPLARVATACCCDGHGRGDAWVSLHFDWDVPWLRAVLKALDVDCVASIWSWDERTLRIAPRAPLADDDALLCMLLDIQAVARAIHDRDLARHLGEARAAVLDGFGAREPSVEAFEAAATEALRAHVSATRDGFRPGRPAR